MICGKYFDCIKLNKHFFNSWVTYYLYLEYFRIISVNKYLHLSPNLELDWPSSFGLQQSLLGVGPSCKTVIKFDYVLYIDISDLQMTNVCVDIDINMYMFICIYVWLGYQLYLYIIHIQISWQSYMKDRPTMQMTTITSWSHSCHFNVDKGHWSTVNWKQERASGKRHHLLSL